MCRDCQEKPSAASSVDWGHFCNVVPSAHTVFLNVTHHHHNLPNPSRVLKEGWNKNTSNSKIELTKTYKTNSYRNCFVSLGASCSRSLAVRNLASTVTVTVTLFLVNLS